MCGGSGVEGEALRLLLFIHFLPGISAIQSGQFIANVMVSAKEKGTKINLEHFRSPKKHS